MPLASRFSCILLTALKNYGRGQFTTGHCEKTAHGFTRDPARECDCCPHHFVQSWEEVEEWPNWQSRMKAQIAKDRAMWLRSRPVGAALCTREQDGKSQRLLGGQAITCYRVSKIRISHLCSMQQKMPDERCSQSLLQACATRSRQAPDTCWSGWHCDVSIRQVPSASTAGGKAAASRCLGRGERR